MTTDSPTLPLRGSADLVAAVPYLLGFPPRESLVLIGIANTRVVVTARLDLVDATPDFVSGACGTLRRNGATGLAAIIVTDRPALASEIHEDVTNAASNAELDVRDVLLVTGDEWRSLHGTDPKCLTQQRNPLPTGSTAVDAAAIYAGLAVLPNREALAAILAPDPERPNLSAALTRHWGLRDAAGEDGELLGWEQCAIRALFAAQRAAEGGRMPTHDAAARFGVALRSYAVRDDAWLAIDDRRLDGAELWIDLARRLPHPYDAAPLFLAGWHAYRQGNGALAGIAADLAQTADPHYRAAALLRQVLSYGIGPRDLPKLRNLPQRDHDVD